MIICNHEDNKHFVIGLLSQFLRDFLPTLIKCLRNHGRTKGDGWSIAN